MYIYLYNTRDVSLSINDQWQETGTSLIVFHLWTVRAQMFRWAAAGRLITVIAAGRSHPLLLWKVSGRVNRFKSFLFYLWTQQTSWGFIFRAVVLDTDWNQSLSRVSPSVFTAETFSPFLKQKFEGFSVGSFLPELCLTGSSCCHGCRVQNGVVGKVITRVFGVDSGTERVDVCSDFRIPGLIRLQLFLISVWRDVWMIL